MGTYQGMKDFEPNYSERLGKTYVYIPKGYAAMSAPAFAAMKADILINHGTLGFHRLFRDGPDGKPLMTETLDMMLRIWMITIHKDRRLVSWEDLQNTSPSDFFYLGEHFNGQVRNWRDLPSDVKMFSKAEDLNQFELPKHIEDKLVGYKLGTRSKQRLEGIHPHLVAVVKRAIEVTDQDFFVGEGLRTLERQKYLFDEGFSKTMNSRHLTGHAVDLHPYPYKGDHDADGIPNSDDWDAYEPIVQAMRFAAADLGYELVHGWDWGWDAPHHQLSRKEYP